MPQPGYYEVAVGGRAVYVRVHGHASMNNCLCLRDFINNELHAARSFFVIDLADCLGMDSTFMGVLAGAATYEHEGKAPGIAAVNASDALIRLLRSVGLTELIFVDPEPFEAPKDLTFVRLDEQASEEARLHLIHAAHEQLIKVSPHNEEVFGPFVAALKLEMTQRGMRVPD